MGLKKKLLLFFLFSSEIKASSEININVFYTLNFIAQYFYSYKSEGRNKGEFSAFFPVRNKTKILTPYFDLNLMSELHLSVDNSREPELYWGEYRWKCNKYVLISTSHIISLSKTKEIKEISKCVSLYFDTSIDLLNLKIILLTIEGGSFKFFHFPAGFVERKDGKKPMPFVLNFCFSKKKESFLINMFGYTKITIDKYYREIKSVHKMCSFLYCFLSCFNFYFVIRIWDDLSLKINLNCGLFFLYFSCLFKNLLLKKEINELKQKIPTINEGAADNNIEGLNEEIKEKLESKKEDYKKNFEKLMILLKNSFLYGSNYAFLIKIFKEG